ncbi:3-[(3aS,4S,7aS)-7a-methyl-1,5-dioxo-octahydro-1H-inden-4-yl]propanoyl:CoA ligase [Aplysia californica]|uniref:3-[(3aS,4S,7aS)-7a-methyl-1, 5-dioxo-octahydro-1H-inden-4-yl]propanoyl:CoA ligase n=1 Tax=Aplysia californica TaxID=6500 RepID=A0ABM0ZVY1_APLCA|nr:3-[(3aS,4S,7aS)-7a-methyl-1,5-dioxo-octahydro-1H-inden-4-yl]propanoyl:CoA ligase [Aplysia californica]
MGCAISGIPDTDDTLCKRLKFLADNFPDRELFIFYDRGVRDVYTSKELFQLGGKFAALLRQKGFQRHDMIVNVLPNSPERLITDVGIILAGCVAMNGQLVRADGADFFESAKKARCRAIVANLQDPGPSSNLFLPYSGETGGSSKRFLDLKIDSAPELTSAINVFRTGNAKILLDELRDSELDPLLEPCDPDDMVKVFTTSGSTGFSKMVPLTHRRLFNVWQAYVDFLGTYGPVKEMGKGGYYNDRALGWVVGFPYGTLMYGLKRVLLDLWFENAQVRSGAAMWNIISKEKCRSSSIMPIDMYNILEHVQEKGDDSFRMDMCMISGQPLRKKLFLKAFRISNTLCVAYGCTEVGCISGSILSEEQLQNLQDFYCGTVPHFLDLRILDKDGNPCAPGEMGTLWVKGLTVFPGYLNQLEEKDPATIGSLHDDGWFDTNDNGYYDDKKNLYVIGRKNDIIMYGAFVVYPGWMEQRIVTHPKVREVCVVPVPHPVLHHDICACVLTDPGSDLSEEELTEFSDQMFLDKSSEESTPRPKYFLIMDKYPTTSTGKPDRKELKRVATEKFGIQ